MPVGQFAGQAKYWPWFWLIFPCYILVTPLAFLLTLPFDHKNLKADIKKLKEKLTRKPLKA